MEPNDKCHNCGVLCDIYPDPPDKAVCPECCEDHEYEYDKWRRGKFCGHCDAEQPPRDWDIFD